MTFYRTSETGLHFVNRVPDWSSLPTYLSTVTINGVVGEGTEESKDPVEDEGRVGISESVTLGRSHVTLF